MVSVEIILGGIGTILGSIANGALILQHLKNKSKIDFDIISLSHKTIPPDYDDPEPSSRIFLELMIKNIGEKATNITDVGLYIKSNGKYSKLTRTSKFDIIKIEPKGAINKYFDFMHKWSQKDEECKIVLIDTDGKKVEKRIVSKFKAPTEEELDLV